MNPNRIGYIYLTVENVLKMHTKQLKRFGGQSGLRNQSGLESAVGQVRATWGSEDLYPDVYIKAAVLGFGISECQAFVDGNKRTAVVAMLTFLKVNGLSVPPAEDRIYEAMISIANKEMNKEGLAELLRNLVDEFNSQVK